MSYTSKPSDAKCLLIVPRMYRQMRKSDSHLLWKYVENWNYIFAGVVVLSLPVTILYLVMQRRFVKGLTAGSIR